MIYHANEGGKGVVDNTKPMYGEVLKSEAYKQIDEKFIRSCLQDYGSIDSSAEVMITFAWKYFSENDLTTAMKRFNQAWLLNPDFPDSYFGFAALMEMQNNKAEAERFYKMGLEKDIDHKRAEICYRQIAIYKKQLNHK
jgi:tetratricopeptide (TPR) repeat protein